MDMATPNTPPRTKSVTAEDSYAAAKDSQEDGTPKVESPDQAPDPAPAPALPILFSGECTLGPKLGSGGFCTVSAVRRIHLLDLAGDTTDNTNDKENGGNNSRSSALAVGLTESEKRDRSRLAKRFEDMEYHHYKRRRNPAPGRWQNQPQPIDAGDPTVQRPPRIALKRLKPGLSDHRYATGLSDLMAEVSTLSVIGNRHPNIINIFAIGLEKKEEEEATDGSHTGRSVPASTESNTRTINTTFSAERCVSFIVLDQLRYTLRNKMYEWREARGLGIAEAMSMAQESSHTLWLERMIVLMKVADAVSYLHSKNILHRDLNPDNIGFDTDNIVKLFDFGLARTVDPKLRLFGTDSKTGVVGGGIGSQDVYVLTGNTGTQRYMAPEIALHFPYGTTADVYSLSIVMHEVLSLYRPYTGIMPGAFRDVVVKGGRRPPLDASWPAGIRTLLSDMWESDPGKRPKSHEVVTKLEALLRGSEADLFPSPGVQRFFFRRRNVS